MGFSVSGATALLFIAFLISFGTFYTATMGAVEQVQEAQVGQQDNSLATLNTEISIQSAKYSGNDGELTVVANNTGAEPLQPTELSLLVDGNYTAFGQEEIDISNSEENDLWAPQQQLTLTIPDDELPDLNGGETVKLITKTGVADTEQVVS